MQQEMRHLLLLEKEQEQQAQMLLHRLEELSPKPELEQFSSLLPMPSSPSLQMQQQGSSLGLWLAEGLSTPSPSLPSSAPSESQSKAT
jgi:hypothetical protein